MASYQRLYACLFLQNNIFLICPLLVLDYTKYTKYQICTLVLTREKYNVKMSALKKNSVTDQK